MDRRLDIRLEGHVLEEDVNTSTDDMGEGAGETATPEAASPHLVIKRGHRGRYRFAFFHEGGRLTGDVRIADRSAARAAQDAEARAEIRKIVAALLAAIQ